MLPSSVSRHLAYSRKQKSLGLLCTNFFNLYDREGIDSVGLDDAAAQLGVERRRIYDIVNVLESVGVLARKAKNRYSWKGWDGIPGGLEELKKEAMGENCGSALGISYDYQRDLIDNGEDDKQSDLSGGETSQEVSGLGSALTGASSFCSLSSKSKTDNRREKSLGLLTRNFVKLFLTTNVDIVSLDEAARLLLCDSSGSTMMRNNSAAKVRRLYDIANVLSSMNLIEKTQHSETKKPAFRWLGFNGKPNYDATACPISSDFKQSKKRQFGEDITNLDPDKRCRMISSGDDKPIKEQMKREDSSVMRHVNHIQEGQQQQHQQPNSKGYVFGPFRPVVQDTERKRLKSAQECEEFASSYRPRYHNEALSDLFAHYMEAWKTWYTEVAQVNNNIQPKRNTLQQPS